MRKSTSRVFLNLFTWLLSSVMGAVDVCVCVIAVSARAHEMEKVPTMVRRRVKRACEPFSVADRADRCDQAGDFEAAMGLVLPKLWRLSLRLTSNQHDAEDLASETLARAYASWGRVRDLEYRDGWILKTAANLAYDATRSRQRRRWTTSPPAAVSFEDALIERQVISSSLRDLPRRQRQAVVLHHMAGCSIGETALSMGISPASVNTHLRRAMSALRANLDEPGSGRL